MIAQYFELGCKARVFRNKFGKVLGVNDFLTFAFPFGDHQYIIKRIPRERIKKDVTKRLQQEEQLKQYLQQQVDPRAEVLKQYDLRPPNLRKNLTPKKIIYPNPKAVLPEPIRTKLNEENPKWLQKYLDKDAEKPDKERRHT